MVGKTIIFPRSYSYYAFNVFQNYVLADMSAEIKNNHELYLSLYMIYNHTVFTIGEKCAKRKCG